MKAKPIPALSAVLAALDKASKAALDPEDFKAIFQIGLVVLEMKQKYEERDE